MKLKKYYFDAWLNEQLQDKKFKKAYEEEDIRARLALRIAELRQKKGISQAQLAKKLHTTQQAVSDIENFKRANITLLTLQKIARALNTRLVVDFQK